MMQRRSARVAVMAAAGLLALSGCSWIGRADVGNDGSSGSGAGGSYFSPLSADGRYVVFVTSASLDPADNDGGLPDVYRRDLVGGTTALVTTMDDVDGTIEGPDASADGNLVVFATTAPIDPNDTNDIGDAYVADVAAGTFERVSVATAGEIGDQTVGVARVRISGDGTTVAIQLEYDDNTFHLFVRDRVNGTTTEIADGVNRSLDGITDDGATVFSSDGEPILFNWADNSSVVIECIAGSGAMSGDGRYVVADFYGDPGCPDGIARYDTGTAEFTDAFVGHGDLTGRTIGAEGRLVVWVSTDPNVNGIEPAQAYVHDFLNGFNQRLSGDAFGNSVHGGSTSAAISADGTISTFWSTGAYPGVTTGGIQGLIVRNTLRPIVVAPSPGGLARGISHVAVFIVGSGFLAPTVDLGPGITVHTSTVVSNGYLVLDVSVAADTDPGPRNVNVTNRALVGSGLGFCPGCFTVT